MNPVRILYTNYKGETAWRVIEPRAVCWGSNEWHPEPQWLLDAWDADRQAVRTFAMKDIREWKWDDGACGRDCLSKLDRLLQGRCPDCGTRLEFELDDFGGWSLHCGDCHFVMGECEPDDGRGEEK